jgi:hypothetical protein
MSRNLLDHPVFVNETDDLHQSTTVAAEEDSSYSGQPSSKGTTIVSGHFFGGVGCPGFDT